MKRALLMTVVLLVLLPGIAKAQWTFDIVSVEAYINDHKKQRSLLLAVHLGREQCPPAQGQQGHSSGVQGYQS